MEAERAGDKDAAAKWAGVVEGILTRDGWLFLHLLRCAILTQPQTLELWFQGPCEMGPWKFPNGLLHDLSSIARGAARDAAKARDAVGHLFAKLDGLSALVKSLEKRVDDLTPGVGESK